MLIRKLINYALLGLAIAAIVAAIEWYRENDRRKLTQAYVDAMRASDTPGQADASLPVSMQLLGIRIAEDQIQRIKGNSLRFERAGAFFLISYLPAAELLPLACAQRGVDLIDFQRTYVSIHKSTLERARRLVRGTPLDEDHLRAQNVTQWRESVENSILGTAKANGRTEVDVCREVASGGAEAAARANLGNYLPRTYSVLFEEAGG